MAAVNFVAALSLLHVIGVFVLLCFLYGLTLGVYRLWFSPIRHIPGPRLAALTQYYEFYYDIVLGGQYTFKIISLHREYGPVIRINPWEVHVADHACRDEVYGGPTRPRQKWAFWTKQFGAPQSALATIDHYDHKLRRAALNPFFSTQSVRNLQPVIEERVDKLLDALVQYARVQQDTPLDVMYPFSAFTNDVINEYAFARSDNLTEQPDFGAAVTNNLLMGTHMGPLIKHANWALTLVNALPESVSSRCVPGWSGFLKMKKDIMHQIDRIRSTQHTDMWQLDVAHPTIFHELFSSKLLPTHEKTSVRLAQEGQILVQGGTLTTSWTLSVAVFHLVKNPHLLKTLRDELFDAIPSPHQSVSLVQLEGLPYLRAVVKEALRHGIGTSGRLPRLVPDEGIILHDSVHGRDWHIPSGAVASMSPYLTIMDEQIFPDPVGFHPERWIEGGERLDKYLVIFGGGTRSCLGMALANAELYLTLAKLFRVWGGEAMVEGTLSIDHRVGDIGVLKIFETTIRDCQMASDYFIPIPYKGSKGIRFVLEMHK